MIYDLECKCGRKVEDVFDHEEVTCPACGEIIDHAECRMFSVPSLHGVHCAGSKVPDYNGYFDPGLDTFITSKQHRAEEMKRQGVVEYEPHPHYAKQREEMRHVRRNSNPGDPEAAKAIKSIAKAADTKRRTDTVNASMKKAFDRVKEGG